MAGNLGNVGSASVTVEGDFTRFFQQLRTEGQRAPAVEVNVEADTTAAMREIESMSPEVTVDTNVDTKGLERQLASGGRGGGNSAAIDFGKSFSKRIGSLNLGSKIFGLIKPVAFIAAVGLAAQAASAAAAGILALTASLANLGGAFVALPAGMFAAAQAMQVFKLATNGVSDALGGLDDKLDPKKLAKLTPPAQAFVRQLDALKPRIKDLQRALQAGLFPGLDAAIRRLSPLLSRFQGPLVGTAVALGDIADSTAAAVASLAGPIAQLLEFNNRLIRVLGDVGTALINSLVTVLLAARPLVLFMATAVAQFANAISGDLAAAAKSNALAEFFDRTRDALIAVTKLFGSLGSILGSILGQATPFGNELLRILNENARALADFLNTTKGKASIAKFFQDAMPGILETGRLIRDLVKAFFTLSKTPGLDATIKTLRTQLLPAIVGLVEATTRDFLPVLLPALTELVKLFISFTGTTGALTQITKALGTMARALNEFFARHPDMLVLANDFATILAIVGGAGLLAALSTLGAGFRLLWTVLGSPILRLGVIALQALATAVVALATAFAAPVALVVAAIASIGIAIFVVVRHWDELKEVFASALVSIKSSLVALGAGIKTWWQGVQIIFAMAVARVQAVGRFYLGVLGGIRAAFGLLLAGVRIWFAGLQSVFNLARAVVARWWAGVSLILGTARAALAGFANRIREIFGGINLFEVGKRVLHTLLDGLKQGFEDVKAFIGTIAKWIRDHKGPISADKKLLVPAGHAIMAGFDKGLHKRWDSVKGWVGNIGGFFKGIIKGDSLKDQVTDILLGRGGIPKLTNQLSAALNIPAQFLSGPAGFLHPTSGWSDTLAQGQMLEKLFNVGITSGLRPGAHTASGNISQHALGQALDFGDSRASHATLTKLASFTSRLVSSIFKQVIWQNSLWQGGTGGHGYIGDHLDHVHLGWQPRAAGGGVQKGRAYSWNERGREMFIPQQSGYVMNAGRTKELVGALKSLAQRPAGGGSSRNAEIHVHSNAADPAAVGSIVMSNLGGVFSRA